MSDIAEVVVSAGWEGADAEAGLDRLGQKFDKTTGRLRDAQGRFVAFKKDTDAATGAISEHGAKLDLLGGKLESAGRAARNVGVALTAGITAPLAAAVGYIISVGTQTSTALNQFQGTSGATVAQMERVRAKAKELGADLTLPGTSAGQAAQSMLELNKGGLSIVESMDAARGSIQLARAAMVSEAQAANITANTLNTFGLAGTEAARVSDVLANAANKSTGDIGDFAQGLAQAGMVAKASNIDLEQTTAVLAMLANNGIKGSDAGTSFKTFLLALRGPSEDARKAMKTLGVDAYDSQQRLKPLGQIVEEFSTKLSGLTDKSRDAFLDKVFGSDGARVAIALFGKGRAELDAYTKSMSEAGTAQKVAEANTRGLAGAWGGLMSSVETLADSIFHDMEAPLTGVVQAVGTAVSWLQDLWDGLGPGAKVIVAALAAVAAAAGPVLVIIGTLVSAVGGFVAALGSIATGVAALGGLGVVLPLLAAGLGAVVAWGAPLAAALAAVGFAAYNVYQAFQKNLGGVRDIALSVFAALRAQFGGFASEVATAWNNIFPTLISVASKFLQGLVSLWGNTFGRLAPVAVAAWSYLGSLARYWFAQLANIIDLWLKLVDGDWKGAWDAFSRIVYRAKEMVTSILQGLGRAIVYAVTQALATIRSLADRFYAAAVELARKLITGLAVEIVSGAPTLTNALTTALILAAANVDVGSIAGGLAAQVFRGLDAALKNGERQYQAHAAGESDATRFSSVRLNEDGSLKKDAPASGGGGGRALNFGGGGRHKGGGAGDGGESVLMKSLKLQLAALDQAAQAAEKIYQRRSSDEQFYYDQGYKSAESYYSMLETLEDERFRALETAGRKEVAIAEQTAADLIKSASKVKDPLKRENILKEAANVTAEANDKLDQIYSEHEQNRTQIQRNAWKTRADEAQTAWANETARLEEYASAQEDIYRELADRGVKTFAEVQALLAGQQLELLIREQKRLENELKGLDPNSTKAKDLRGQLDTQNQKVSDFRAANPYNAAAAARQDVEREAQRADAIRQIRESIADSDRAVEAERLRILEAAGVSRTELWRAQARFELEGEEQQTERVIAELRRRIALTEKLESNPEHRKALISELNRQIEAEERASTPRRASILEDYYKKQDERLRSYVDKAVGALRKAFDAAREGGLKGFFSSLAEDFRNALLQMADDLLKSRLLQLLRNIWKIPAPGSTQGASAAAPGGAFLDFFKQALHLGGGNGDAEAVSAAGDAMKGAIEQGGTKAAQKTTEAGERQAISIRGVGVQIVGALAAIGSQIAAGAGRGSFWKGLLFAAASGAVSGAAGAAFAPGGGGHDGSSPGTGGKTTGAANGGMFSAKSGGRLVLLAEAGYDELVLTTDPAQRGRMAQLLAAYSRMTGLTTPQPFARGGFTSGYVPPSPLAGSSTSNNRTNNYSINVTVNSNGEVTDRQARRTGRQIARATRGALGQYAA